MTHCENKKALTRRAFASQSALKRDYFVSPAGAAGAASVGAGAAVPSAGVAAGVSVAAGVASVVAGACSAGWFLEQVKPVVKDSASKDAITIAFIVVVPSY